MSQDQRDTQPVTRGELRAAFEAAARSFAADPTPWDAALAALSTPAPEREVCAGFVCGGFTQENGQHNPGYSGHIHQAACGQGECICASCRRGYAACMASRTVAKPSATREPQTVTDALPTEPPMPNQLLGEPFTSTHWFAMRDYARAEHSARLAAERENATLKAENARQEERNRVNHRICGVADDLLADCREALGIPRGAHILDALRDVLAAKVPAQSQRDALQARLDAVEAALRGGAKS